MLVAGGGDIPTAILPELELSTIVTVTPLDKLEFETTDAAAGTDDDDDDDDDDDGTTAGNMDADKVLLSPECWK